VGESGGGGGIKENECLREKGGGADSAGVGGGRGGRGLTFFGTGDNEVTG